MNFSFYILGTPEGRYSQYPDDYTASTLAKLQEGMTGARLVIYREMDLVHYAYTERLGNNSIIGFCLIFNKARIQKPRQLIRLFRFIIEKRLVESGEIIRYTDNGELKFRVRGMSECVKEYDRLKSFLNSEFEYNASKYDIEPITTTYNGVKSIGELDRNASDGQIIALTNLHNKVIINDDNGIEHGYIPQVIASLREQNKRNAELSAKLSAKLIKTKVQQRNIIWLSVLGATALIFGVIVWNKVLFPSEVTHYETGEFVYYGPLKNNKPHGTGVAIYPKNDVDGRKYYIGEFVEGERQDTAAILFYQDGDYYYGSMQGDKWDKGILYMNSDNSHFTGFFKDNEPYSGKWYDHKELYKLVDGQKVYSNKKSR